MEWKFPLKFTAVHLTKGIREEIFVNYFILTWTDTDWIYNCTGTVSLLGGTGHNISSFKRWMKLEENWHAQLKIILDTNSLLGTELWSSVWPGSNQEYKTTVCDFLFHCFFSHQLQTSQVSRTSWFSFPQYLTLRGKCITIAPFFFFFPQLCFKLSLPKKN